MLIAELRSEVSEPGKKIASRNQLTFGNQSHRTRRALRKRPRSRRIAFRFRRRAKKKQKKKHLKSGCSRNQTLNASFSAYSSRAYEIEKRKKSRKRSI